MQYRTRGVSAVDMNSPYDPMEEKAIALLAYQYWEQRGRPFGSPDEDWFRAEREIRARTRWTLAPSTEGRK